MSPLRLAPALLALSLLMACSADEGSDSKPRLAPNILFILVDDLGYNDLGLNNPVGALTPRLDAFAKQGVYFDRNYVDSTCAATRAGILTGRPPVASGFRPSGLGISPETETLPEALQSLGYSTHHIGKWHLGYASRLAWPTSQGFDTFYGFLNQFVLRGPHKGGELKLGRPRYDNPWLQENESPPQKTKGYLSDLLAQKAVDFLNQAPAMEQPWFLNYWTYLPHGPIQPAERFARQFPDTPEGRYQAMVAHLDASIGRVLDALARNQLDDNTVVVIASDNGGTNSQTDNNAPFKGFKASFAEGGVRTPLMIRWPDGRWSGSRRDEVVSYLDYLPTLVAAAGGQADGELPGRNLALLSQGRELEPRALYWEAGDSIAQMWGVLSVDGRWRLHQYLDSPAQLYDLDADPAGSDDVSARYPDVSEALYVDYLDWRARQRRVAVEYLPKDAEGRGLLRGQSLQRSPGFGGFTFAIGTSAAAEPGAVEQIIAAQPGLWRLTQADGQLRLVMPGVRLQAPAPPPGECAAVIVTALYAHRHVNPKSSEVLVELYIDGQLEAQARRPRPQLPPDLHERPTLIGQGQGGRNPYMGRLGQPVIFNERISASKAGDIAALSREVCMPLVSDNLALHHAN